VTTPQVVHQARDLRELVDAWHTAGQAIALVPTMGALHSGHLALIHRASEIADRVVVSIFVNPLQFSAGEDFDRYPRGLDDDVATLRNAPVDVVFAPEVTDVYPDWPETTPTHHAGPVGDTFEGAARPGHFDGVLTVVNRLFDLVGCDVAVFGQKDAQQAYLVGELAASRTPPVAIDIVPTVRDSSGLARSSRNRYLSEDAWREALALPEALGKITDLITSSLEPLRREQIDAALHAAIDDITTRGVVCDYLEVVDQATFLPWRGGDNTTRVVVIGACLVAGVRLLDAEAVTLPRPPGH